MYDYASTFGKMAENRPEAALEYMNEKTIQIARYNRKLVAPFVSIMTREIIARKVEEEDRELMYKFNKMSKYYREKETKGILESITGGGGN
ncbi:hypothetical protein THIOSC15_2140003 [uncultured Thiomicrorhabdus sp.]